MTAEMLFGMFLPFFGTAAGAACVLFMRKKKQFPKGMAPQDAGERLQKILLGFAAGVMVAASVWSLLIPAIEMSEDGPVPAFIPAAVGFSFGILFLLLLDHLIPHQHMNEDGPEGPHSKLGRLSMLTLAVTLHNIPEGMAAGVVFAAVLAGEGGIRMADAFALVIGIAIQNFPEGAIISLPMKNAGGSKGKAFLCGALSGAVEPIAAVLTVLLSGLVAPILPYLLAFAAGAMIYVVVEELVPESVKGASSDFGTVGFGIGFLIMMILDVALG
ncbi:MAG: ZIP family metal transporter [Lachnospiraceae bacterium]|nr:ZIP family metal transporter [Lachnospiraceae bacterium]